MQSLNTSWIRKGTRSGLAKVENALKCIRAPGLDLLNRKCAKMCKGPSIGCAKGLKYRRAPGLDVLR